MTAIETKAAATFDVVPSFCNARAVELASINHSHGPDVRLGHLIGFTSVTALSNVQCPGCLCCCCCGSGACSGDGLWFGLVFWLPCLLIDGWTVFV